MRPCRLDGDDGEGLLVLLDGGAADARHDGLLLVLVDGDRGGVDPRRRAEVPKSHVRVLR